MIVAVALPIGLLGLPARAADVPDLTGSWIQPDNPDAPAWALDASSDRSTLDASWHGGEGPHSSLVGSFHGTLNQAGTAYSGEMRVREGSNPPVNGTMAFRIDSHDHLSMSYRQDNGVSGTAEFERGFAPVVPPPIGWCASVPPNTGCLTVKDGLPPGGDSVVVSPKFEDGQTAATAIISDGDPADTNAVVSSPVTNACPQSVSVTACVRRAASCVRTAQREQEDYVEHLLVYPEDEAAHLDEFAFFNVIFIHAFLSCLDDLHRQQAAAEAAASASCGTRVVRINIKRATRRSVIYKPLRTRVTAPVIMTCKRTSSGLTLHVKKRRHGPSLRKALGPSLAVGVDLRRRARHIATLRAAFASR